MKRRSPETPGSPAACGILACKQSLAQCSKLVINTSPNRDRNGFVRRRSCTPRMLKRWNRVRTSGVSLSESGRANFLVYFQPIG